MILSDCSNTLSLLNVITIMPMKKIKSNIRLIIFECLNLDEIIVNAMLKKVAMQNGMIGIIKNNIIENI